MIQQCHATNIWEINYNVFNLQEICNSALEECNVLQKHVVIQFKLVLNKIVLAIYQPADLMVSSVLIHKHNAINIQECQIILVKILQQHQVVNVGEQQHVQIDSALIIQVQQVKMIVINSSKDVSLQEQNVWLNKVYVQITLILHKQHAMPQLIYRGINVLCLQLLGLAKLGNAQMSRQTVLHIYHLVYLLGLHVKFNRQPAIYTHLLHKKHVIMLQTHMEINAGWKVQDLLLVLQEVAVIQYWGLAL